MPFMFGPLVERSITAVFCVCTSSQLCHDDLFILWNFYFPCLCLCRMRSLLSVTLLLLLALTLTTEASRLKGHKGEMLNKPEIIISLNPWVWQWFLKASVLFLTVLRLLIWSRTLEYDIPRRCPHSGGVWGFGVSEGGSWEGIWVDK